MTTLRPRKRLVNFRLTQDEYEHLAEACLHKGAPSISDFARAAILRSMETQVWPEGPLQNRLSELETKVSHLEGCVRQLAELLGRRRQRRGCTEGEDAC